MPVVDMTEGLSPREYTVGLEDGGNVTYTLRGLAEEEVKPCWTTFCASIFAYKTNPPPPEYFERHYFNDPLRKASLIRVALTSGENPQIVASCRVFQRQISNGSGGMLLAGGIGEVCTTDSHRRRGLAKELLLDCIELMSKCGMSVSLLHAAPAFFPVYQKMGYECTISRWSSVDVVATPSEMDYSWTCREAVFPDDTKSTMAMHQSFSERKFAGCLIRSESYWNNYLSVELNGTFFVLADPTTNKVVAWLSLRSRGDRWQLRDFCYEPRETCTLSGAFRRLLVKALASSGGASLKQLHLPTFLVDQLKKEGVASASDQEWIAWDTLTEENDEGWMYRPLGDNDFSMANAESPHLIWPADSF